MLALGPGPALARRRSGNVIMAGLHELPGLDRLRAALAADPSPAGLLGPEETAAFIGGAPPWRDR